MNGSPQQPAHPLFAEAERITQEFKPLNVAIAGARSKYVKEPTHSNKMTLGALEAQGAALNERLRAILARIKAEFNISDELEKVLDEAELAKSGDRVDRRRREDLVAGAVTPTTNVNVD